MKPSLTLALLFALTFSVVGCGPAVDPRPMLNSLGEIKHSMHDIIEELELGDLDGADQVMHRSGFKAPFDMLKVQAKRAGLPPSVEALLLDNKDKLWKQVQTVHDSMHGGSIEDVDVEGITAEIESALEAISGALPAGMKIPDITHDEHGPDDHAGHDHGDGDHDDHDHDDDHDDEGHDHADGDNDHDDHEEE